MALFSTNVQSDITVRTFDFKIVDPVSSHNHYLKNYIVLSINFQTNYNLGNTYRTENPETAIEVFLKREFPQFLESKTKPHDLVFIPDYFICGVAAKVQ